MGRGFSTAYRIVLVIFAAGALVMSIMSATSCAFVKYDHQYKSEGRLLQDGDTDPDGVTDPGTATDPLGMAGVDPTVTDPAGFDTTVPLGTDPTDPAGTDPTTDPATITDPASVATAETATDPSTTVDPATMIDPTAALDPAAEGGVIDPTSITDPATVGTDPADVDPAPVGADPSASFTDPAAIGTDPASPVDTTVPSPTDTEIPDTMEDETLGQGEFPWGELNEEGTSGDNAGPGGTSEDTANAFGATGGSSTASAAEEPVAQVSGDAGLFCDSEKKLSITNLWGGTLSDFEAEIAAESDKNTSEELAKNAIIAAVAFGSFALFLLMIESIIGWRMCCEKWIIGLVSVMACVSQGVTFLFFNSERYCDGDIVHEILNQEPCVIGLGGIYAIVALVLYFIMVIMCCKLPQDDPYGLCCKNRNRGESAPTSSGSGKFGLLGSSKNEETFKGSSAQDPRRERPGWLSEDVSKKVEEGDEII